MTATQTDLHPSIIRLCENYAKFAKEADQAARKWDTSTLHRAALNRSHAWNALVCASGCEGSALDYWETFRATVPDLYA